MENTHPYLSIIVPCCNEANNIEGCLQSILGQKPPDGGFELIVADGMSTDGTRSILDRVACGDSRVRILENKGKIVSTGLNLGIQAAKGKVIMRMDAHTEYANGLCGAMPGKHSMRTKADNVGGPCRARGFSTVGRAIAAAFQSPFAVGGSYNHNVNYEGPIDTVYLGCWPRQVFSDIGMFDEELVRNQDDEFNFRMRQAGKALWQSPKIKSIYHTRETIGKLFRQYLQYSYWKVKVIRKYNRPASIRHLIPSSFCLALIGLPLASIWWPWAGKLFWAMVLLYGILFLLWPPLPRRGKSEWRLLPLFSHRFCHLPFRVWYRLSLGGMGFLNSQGASQGITRKDNPVNFVC